MHGGLEGYKRQHSKLAEQVVKIYALNVDNVLCDRALNIFILGGEFFGWGIVVDMIYTRWIREENYSIF